MKPLHKQEKKPFTYSINLLIILALLLTVTPLLSQTHGGATDSASTVAKSPAMAKTSTEATKADTETTKAETTEPKTESKDSELPQAISPDGKGNLTFTPGLRIQTRYNYDTGAKDHDILIRRVRLKGKGKVFDVAKYYFEIKIDNSYRFDSSPKAVVENAWVEFPFAKDVNLRVGEFDNPFSRNALTSDSKLLFLDRTLIKFALTTMGLADNTVGFLLHGRPLGGRLTYAGGIFDNVGFEVAGVDSTVLERKATTPMVTLRMAYDFLDPASENGYGDYRGSFNGSGSRLTFGTNISYVPKAGVGDVEYAILAWGADLFFNMGPATIEMEYDSYVNNFTTNGTPDLNGSGWYAQGAVIIAPNVELAARYQEMEPDNKTIDDKLQWVSGGLNYYIKDHTLKIQAEYLHKLEEGTAVDNNIFQVQLQLDF